MKTKSHSHVAHDGPPEGLRSLPVLVLDSARARMIGDRELESKIAGEIRAFCRAHRSALSRNDAFALQLRNVALMAASMPYPPPLVPANSMEGPIRTAPGAVNHGTRQSATNVHELLTAIEIRVQRLLRAAAVPISERRSAAMSKAQLAKRIQNNKKAKPDAVNWSRFDLKQEPDSAKKWTVRTDNMDAAMRERVEAKSD